MKTGFMIVLLLNLVSYSYGAEKKGTGLPMMYKMCGQVKAKGAPIFGGTEFEISYQVKDDEGGNFPISFNASTVLALNERDEFKMPGLTFNMVRSLAKGAIIFEKPSDNNASKLETQFLALMAERGVQIGDEYSDKLRGCFNFIRYNDRMEVFGFTETDSPAALRKKILEKIS